MKTLAAVIFLTFSGLSSAFMMGTQCNFNQAHGECSVYNDTPNTISCRINIFGQVRSGATFNGFEFATLYPGQYAYAYVNANNPYIDPLVIVRGNATCNVLY